MKIKVIKGIKPLEQNICNTLEHWALGFEFDDGEKIWYEIEGASIEDINAPNKIAGPDNSTDKYDNFEPITTIECESKKQFMSEMEQWNNAWIRIPANKNYALTDANCQKYVSDYGQTVGAKIPTQNSTLGSNTIIVGCLGGLSLIAVGIYGKGSHPFRLPDFLRLALERLGRKEKTQAESDVVTV